MLEKSFFLCQPKNPYPYKPGTLLVNLSGASLFEKDTIFAPGEYSVEVEAGNFGTGRVAKTIKIYEPFIIKAYCGSAGDWVNGIKGVNPYQGEFKVNPFTGSGQPPYVNHIFGNAGSRSVFYDALTDTSYSAGGGNCLGDGIVYDGGGLFKNVYGAGSCLHFLPVGGVFGKDYLFAAHTCSGGNGSAYGGAGSGQARDSTEAGKRLSVSAGGSTPYGAGGAGVISPGTHSNNFVYGNNGSGVGAGSGSGRADAKSAAAYFYNGKWNNSDSGSGQTEQGIIKVKFVGAL